MYRTLTSYFRILFLFLSIPNHTVQVDITMSRPPSVWDNHQGVGTHGYASSVTCRNVLPGHCCTTPVGPACVSRHGASAEFTNLLAGDIAAVWNDPVLTPSQGCDRSIVDTAHGPARSRVFQSSSSLFPITGASYITVPKVLPPSESVSQWLMAEGMLALVWGGGYWVSKHARNFPTTKLTPRGITSKNKGTFYAKPPPRWVYADLITVNGTEYTNHKHGGLVYESNAGAVLNLTAGRIRL